jgi:actin-related protein
MNPSPIAQVTVHTHLNSLKKDLSEQARGKKKILFKQDEAALREDKEKRKKSPDVFF